MATSINYAIQNYNAWVKEQFIKNPKLEKVISFLLVNILPKMLMILLYFGANNLIIINVFFLSLIIFLFSFTFVDFNFIKKLMPYFLSFNIDNFIISLIAYYFKSSTEEFKSFIISYIVVNFSLLVVGLTVYHLKKILNFKEKNPFNKIHYLIIAFSIFLYNSIIIIYQIKYNLGGFLELWSKDNFKFITIFIIFLYYIMLCIVDCANKGRCFFTERTQDFNKLLSMFKRIYNVIFNKTVSLLNNAIKLLKEMHFMVIDLLKRKYISKGLVNFTLRDISDLYSIFGINLLNIKGFVDLDEANRNSFKIFIVNFYNALSLDSKPKIHPLSVNYVKEIEYYIKGPDEDILIVGKKLFKMVDNEEIILEDYIDKKYEKQEVFKDEPIYYLRFDYLFDNKKEWLHIKEDGITWY